MIIVCLEASDKQDYLNENTLTLAIHTKIYGLYVIFPNIFCETKKFLRTRFASSVTFSISDLHTLLYTLHVSSILLLTSYLEESVGKISTLYIFSMLLLVIYPPFMYPEPLYTLYGSSILLMVSYSPDMNPASYGCKLSTLYV